MESETNKKIREKLEELGINPYEMHGDYAIIGHLSLLFYKLRIEHYKRMAAVIDSHGFMEFLMGRKEYKDKEN